MANVDQYTQYGGGAELIKSYQDLTVSNGQWAASMANGATITVGGFFAPVDMDFSALIYNNGQYSLTGASYYDQLPRVRFLSDTSMQVLRYSNGTQPMPRITAAGTLATLRVLEFEPTAVNSVQHFTVTPGGSLSIAPVDPNKTLVFWSSAVVQNAPSYTTGYGVWSGGSWYFINNSTLGWRAAAGLLSNHRMALTIVETL